MLNWRLQSATVSYSETMPELQEGGVREVQGGLQGHQEKKEKDGGNAETRKVKYRHNNVSLPKYRQDLKCQRVCNYCAYIKI